MPRAACTAVAAAALAAALSHGCAPVPTDGGLTFAIPPKYDAAASVAAPTVSRWWTRFGSRELDALMAFADRENLDVAAAFARLEQAEAQARITRAALFPLVEGSGDASRSQSSGTTGSGIGPTSRRNSFSKQLSASYELDLWGKNRDALRASLASRDASLFDVETVRLTTRASVVNGYLDYAATAERLRLASENLENAERITGVIRQRLSAGTGSALDLAQQESLLAQRQARLPPLRQSMDAARTSLSLLLGKPPQGFRLTGRGMGGLTTPSVAPGLPSSLLARRPDVRAAEAQLASADADISVARKELLPTVALTGSRGQQSARLSDLLRPESIIWSVAAGVTQPIFEGGRLRAQVELTIAQRQELLETYRKSIVSALTDVENALVAIRETRAQIAAQRVVVEKSRQAFQLSETQLREGTIDLVTLLNTQNSLFEAQDSLVQARLAHLQALVSLFQALGGDWEDPVAAALAEAAAEGPETKAKRRP